MAVACTQEAILDFVKERGGKVKHAELIAHFRAVFPEEPELKAAVRNSFKNHVDNVAYVKTESGVKFVCLKKKFSGTSGTETRVSNEEKHVIQRESGEEPAHCAQGPHGEEAQPQPVIQQTMPGSGYGSDSSQVRLPCEDRTETSKCPEFVCGVEDTDSSSGEMGNTGSFRRDRGSSKKRDKSVRGTASIPQITLIEASPLPAQGAVFVLPGPVLQTGCTAPTAGCGPTDRHVQSLSGEGPKEADQNEVIIIRQLQSDNTQSDSHSLAESEGSNSRHHFMEVMMNSSPQVRRSMALRGSVFLSSRSDSDTASLVSSTLDDDRTPVTLDPAEHEWMMRASDAEWGGLQSLLSTDPGLLLRKDFVTGFTCLHWAAKHGKPELIALIVNFAKQHHVPVSVDVRSNTGYTPLHVAAMHSHVEVVKLLVGAYGADTELLDYSGRKACHYLTHTVSQDIQDIVGAHQHPDEQAEGGREEEEEEGRWRFSRVLQSNLGLLSPPPSDKPLRRRSSLSRMKPNLQKLRMRTSQLVHSTSFSHSDGRPKTHFFG